MIRQVTSKKEVMRVLTHESIWPNISEGYDYTPETVPFVENFIYLTVTGNEIFMLDDRNRFHSNILPCSRGKAYFYIEKALQWIFENTDLTVINLEIPTKYPKFVRLAQYCRFNIVRRASNDIILARCRYGFG